MNEPEGKKTTIRRYLVAASLKQKKAQQVTNTFIFFRH